MGLACSKCGGHVSGAGHSCVGGPSSTSAILLDQIAEIASLKAKLRDADAAWQAAETYKVVLCGELSIPYELEGIAVDDMLTDAMRALRLLKTENARLLRQLATPGA